VGREDGTALVGVLPRVCAARVLRPAAPAAVGGDGDSLVTARSVCELTFSIWRTDIMNRIVGGNTLISDSFAPYGMLPQTADRPEPTEADREAARRADRVEEHDLLRALNWTSDDLRTAQGEFGFPCGQLTATPRFGRAAKWRMVYSRRLIDSWTTRITALLGGAK
jgi:hypothetical protein